MAHGAARAWAFVACAAGALAMFLGAAQAQTRTLTQVERDRSAASARAQLLRHDADAARRDVQALDARLVGAGARRTQAEAAAADAEQRLVALHLQLEADGARYQRDRDGFEAALIAAAFTRRRLEISAVRAGIFARAAAPFLRQNMQRTAASLEAGRQLDAAIAGDQQILVDAQAAIESERTEITALLESRRAAQTRLVADANAAERRVQQLAAEAHSLRELAQQMAARSRAAPRGADSAGAVLPAAWLAPAEGQIARNFGASVAGGPPAQGVALRTRVGAQVVAPAAGEIAYAGLFRGYGQVLILNLDNGYAVVLTGLDTLSARVGDNVRAGQPIGEMSASATPAPELYVEVRRDGQPVDPARWLRSRGLASAEAGGQAG